MLTILGILLGFFVILLHAPNQPIQSNYIILTGFGTSISMLISGISGSYLSERAEQKKDKKELDRAMGIVDEKKMSKEDYETREKENQIKQAMITSAKTKDTKIKKRISFKEKKEKKRQKTIHEKAESFTGIIVSLVNGISPFLGGIVPIIPFLFVAEAGIASFIQAFVIIFICIIFLGIFLGIISKESIIKNIIQMLAAFTITIFITILIFGF